MAYTDKWLERIILNPNAEGEAAREGFDYSDGSLPPTAPGEYYVDVNVKLTTKEVRELRASRNRAVGDETKYLTQFLLGQIAGWNLDDGEGTLEITSKSVEELDRDDSAKLVTAISAGRRRVRTPAEETDFS